MKLSNNVTFKRDVKYSMHHSTNRIQNVSAVNSHARSRTYIKSIKIPNTNVLFMIAAPISVEYETVIVVGVFFLAIL